MLNKREKTELLREAAARSRAVPDAVHYALYGGCFIVVTTDPERAEKLKGQGYTLYCKMLAGNMIL